MSKHETAGAVPWERQRRLREIYQSEILPPLFLENPEEFYEAFDRGPEAAETFFRDKWEWMCDCLADDGMPGVRAVPCPVTGMDCLALDEREECFSALLTVELAEPAGDAQGLALYVSAFFGVGRMPRLFYGEYAALPGGETTVEVTELRFDREGALRRLRRGTLHQGCDNRPLLFDPPETPLPEDPARPLVREAWYAAYLDRTARACTAGG